MRACDGVGAANVSETLEQTCRQPENAYFPIEMINEMWAIGY